ncbi:MAG: DUF6575 domain-containing protein [Sphaerospermopsis kisseleviana]
MSILPENTLLKKLEIIEVYAFYDKPVLFSCKNQFGLVFIAIFVNSSEFAETWLYASVSLSRFQSVTKADMKIRHIFTETENGFVYQVEIPNGGEKKAIVTNVKCSEIPDDYLPD